MLIYLDANIVQYCADHWDFVSGESAACKTADAKLQKELEALRRLVELEQLGDWTFAAPAHLLAELRGGKGTGEQLDTYKLLEKAWVESVWCDDIQPTEETVGRIGRSLATLRLKDADQRHLAEAIALNASWFLTNDGEVVKKAEGRFAAMQVCRPSECLEEISVGLFLK